MNIGIQQIFEEHIQMRKVLEKIVKDKSYSVYMDAYLLDKDLFEEIQWLVDVMDRSRSDE